MYAKSIFTAVVANKTAPFESVNVIIVLFRLALMATTCNLLYGTPLITRAVCVSTVGCQPKLVIGRAFAIENGCRSFLKLFVLVLLFNVSFVSLSLFSFSDCFSLFSFAVDVFCVEVVKYFLIDVK